MLTTGTSLRSLPQMCCVQGASPTYPPISTVALLISFLNLASSRMLVLRPRAFAFSEHVPGLFWWMALYRWWSKPCVFSFFLWAAENQHGLWSESGAHVG
ncbi:uncharacterized protein IWZ02DRAFT_136960 [Phyllosticta citriasiana]|uniref:Uncharacterized protein n=1 Tax=Phyllosticta citriasiana TaxID=595635 RepID=A0ABR1KV57_9PEZI